jgi:hypothetical protein
VTKLRVVAACWGGSIILGAAWLRTFHPRNRTVARVLASEVTHISAHVVLYAALTAILWFATSGRRSIVIVVTAVVALLQEGAQTVLWGRRPGLPEVFDLCVDAAALALALLLCKRSTIRTIDASTPVDAPAAGADTLGR